MCPKTPLLTQTNDFLDVYDGGSVRTYQETYPESHSVI